MAPNYAYSAKMQAIHKAISTLHRVANEELKPIIHAHWNGNWVSTDEDLDGYFDGYKCSKCEEQSEARYLYCPNCGALMDEEDDNHNGRR